MSKKTVVGGLILLVFLGILAAALVYRPKANGVSQGGGGKIAVIFIEGEITGDSGGDIFGGGAGSFAIMEQLKQAREDDSVQAVLLRLNTPGGSSPAAQEIGMEVEKLKQAGKIVVASMGDMAASGGYWIAALADKIVANPATMTGSIGVIMELQNLEELYRKIGIDIRVVKSGPHKDMGSSARELTPEERQILQAMVDDIYNQFVEVVAKGRKLSVERVKELADGRVYTGAQAKELGLVDELGNYYDAIKITAQMAGIKGEPQIVRYDARSPWELFLGGLGSRLELFNYASDKALTVR
jgi:protease-4